jgi:multidrug efflux system membrane fusion protein
MTRKTWGLGVAALLVVVGIGLMTRSMWSPQGAVAQAPEGQRGPRPIPVEIALAERKKVPLHIDALGAVTPIASVAIKSRLETEIVGVHFADGALVKQGDLLFTLDSRALEAQIRQAEGNLARSKAQLEGAERDVRRFSELVAKQATPLTNLDNAKTQADVFRAQIVTDQALLDNLRVQLSYCTIRAPIAGRISTANVKIGNFVRPADVAPLATIIQIAPVYVTFPVAQRYLPDIRQAVASESAVVDAHFPGDKRQANGQVTLIENTVDMTTGMATIRATMPNSDELLWPGALVNTKLTLRVDDVVSVPTIAVQVGQQGNFVYVVKDGAAHVQPVKVARVADGQSVIESGLSGGETVVTDGHLLLTNGARIAPRERRAGA